MPRGDRNGPNGMGPMSGRAAGYCANYDNPGFMNRFFGGGFGAGFGRNRRGGRQGGGLGWRNMFRALGFRGPDTGSVGFGRKAVWQESPPKSNPDTEKQVLKDQVEALKIQLDLLQNRLNKLDPPVTDE